MDRVKYVFQASGQSNTGQQSFKVIGVTTRRLFQNYKYSAIFFLQGWRKLLQSLHNILFRFRWDCVDLSAIQ